MHSRPGLCLDSAQMALSGSRVEVIVWAYFMPPVILIGIVGNLLTLMVLLSKEMRSRANILLAALSFFGTLCLILLIPHSMASIEFFNGMRNFRLIYFTIKTYLTAFANWSSAVVSWLVVAVCAERLIGTRNPFHARQEFKVRNTAMMIGIITLIAGCLTFYHQYHFHCVTRSFCRDTQIVSRCYDVTKDSWYGSRTNPTEPWLKEYIRWSVIANAIFIVIVPNILLIFLNSALICAMKRQGILHSRTSSTKATLLQKSPAYPGKVENGAVPSKTLVTDRPHVSYTSLMAEEHSRVTSNASSEGRVMILRRDTSQRAQRAGQKMAITVCAIVTCFTVTQGPSAIVLAVNMLSGSTSHWQSAKTLTSLLTVIGITLNFFLFCLISSNFRRRLKAMISPHSDATETTTITECETIEMDIGKKFSMSENVIAESIITRPVDIPLSSTLFSLQPPATATLPGRECVSVGIQTSDVIGMLTVLNEDLPVAKEALDIQAVTKEPIVTPFLPTYRSTKDRTTQTLT